MLCLLVAYYEYHSGLFYMYPWNMDHLAAYAQKHPAHALYIVLLRNICLASNPFEKLPC
jgi:hypothetical protein